MEEKRIALQGTQGSVRNPKRLLCIVSNMDAGGAETFLMKMYRKLDRSAYQMDFCVSGPSKGYYDDEIKSMGGRIFRICPKTKGFVRYSRDLKEVFVAGCYDRVLRIGSSSFSALDLWIARRCGVGVRAMRSSNASDGAGLLGSFLHRATRALLTSAATVKIAPSDLAASYTFGMKAVRNGGVSFLKNAIDFDEFKFDEVSRDRIRRELGAVGESLVVGHVGRFSKQKNHAFLLDAFAAVHEARPDAILALVGKGELEAEVLGKAEELGVSGSVRLLGVRSDVPALLSAFDVLAFPSLYEGMPNVVIEAQAAGLPCIVSDTITREANVTGRVSYLSIDDPSEWAAAVLSAESGKRYDGVAALRAGGYDIDKEVGRFVELVYG